MCGGDDRLSGRVDRVRRGLTTQRCATCLLRDVREFVCEQLTYALRGQWAAEVNLPLQLSDAVTLVSVAALP